MFRSGLTNKLNTDRQPLFCANNWDSDRRQSKDVEGLRVAECTEDADRFAIDVDAFRAVLESRRGAHRCKNQSRLLHPAQQFLSQTFTLDDDSRTAFGLVDFLFKTRASVFLP